MLTSDLYWTDWRATNNAWESIVLTLRRIERSTNGSEVVAHVVRMGNMFTVEFTLSSLYVTESPVFITVADAKAYTHMTCLLTLKEN